MGKKRGLPLVVFAVVNQGVLVRLVAGWTMGAWLVLVPVPILAEVLIAGFGSAARVSWSALIVEALKTNFVSLAILPSFFFGSPAPYAKVLVLDGVLKTFGLDRTHLANPDGIKRAVL